jgi:hypothetical protein
MPTERFLLLIGLLAACQSEESQLRVPRPDACVEDIVDITASSDSALLPTDWCVPSTGDCSQPEREALRLMAFPLTSESCVRGEVAPRPCAGEPPATQYCERSPEGDSRFTECIDTCSKAKLWHIESCKAEHRDGVRVCAIIHPSNPNDDDGFGLDAYVWGPCVPVECVQCWPALWSPSCPKDSRNPDRTQGCEAMMPLLAADNDCDTGPESDGE